MLVSPIIRPSRCQSQALYLLAHLQPFPSIVLQGPTLTLLAPSYDERPLLDKNGPDPNVRPPRDPAYLRAATP